MFIPKTLSNGPQDPEEIKSIMESKNSLGMIDNPNQKLEIIKNRRMSLNLKITKNSLSDKDSKIENNFYTKQVNSQNNEKELIPLEDKNSNIMSQLVLRDENKNKETKEPTYSKYFKNNKIAVSKLVNPILEESKDSLSCVSKSSSSGSHFIESLNKKDNIQINNNEKPIVRKSFTNLSRKKTNTFLTTKEVKRSHFIKIYNIWVNYFKNS
jgi:hypothetical protein